MILIITHIYICKKVHIFVDFVFVSEILRKISEIIIFLKYIKYIHLYTNTTIKSNWNLSIQLYILSIFLKKYEGFVRFQKFFIVSAITIRILILPIKSLLYIIVLISMLMER